MFQAQIMFKPIHVNVTLVPAQIKWYLLEARCYRGRRLLQTISGMSYVRRETLPINFDKIRWKTVERRRISRTNEIRDLLPLTIRPTRRQREILKVLCQCRHRTLLSLSVEGWLGNLESATAKNGPCDVSKGRNVSEDGRIDSICR